jgi:hypothetical protein
MPAIAVNQKHLYSVDLIAAGVRKYENSDDTTMWWVLGPNWNMSDEELCESMGIFEDYVGPGREFFSEPVVWRTFTRILITQDSGWAI